MHHWPEYKSQLQKRCCYITVDFAMAASHVGVSITQQMCHIMVLFHDCSTINDEINKKMVLPCSEYSNISFLMRGKLASTKSIL
jgi:hypothetical protein